MYMRCFVCVINRIKAKVRARGARNYHWYNESRVQMLRRKCRTQSLFNLHLAGDWHHSAETMPPGSRPHMMRVMLISNLAVDQRFANGPMHSMYASRAYPVTYVDTR